MTVARFALIAVILVAGCGGGETVTVGETVTQTETESVTVTEAAAPVGLPAPVAETHAELLAAARGGDYEALGPLIPDEFSYTFGGPVEGGPIAFWQGEAEASGAEPIDVLARILELPYTLTAGIYVWPFAFDTPEAELTAHERELLGDLADSYAGDTGYLGWRAGIRPDGTWVFFIAGD